VETSSSEVETSSSEAEHCSWGSAVSCFGRAMLPLLPSPVSKLSLRGCFQNTHNWRNAQGRHGGLPLQNGRAQRTGRRAGRNVGAGPCACPAWECLIANFG
jgi:hypothetical protein